MADLYVIEPLWEPIASPPRTERVLQAEIDRVMEPYELGRGFMDQEECECIHAELKAVCERLGFKEGDFAIEVWSSMKTGAHAEVITRYSIEQPDGHCVPNPAFGEPWSRGDEPRFFWHPPWPVMTWELFQELFGDGDKVYRQMERRVERERRAEAESEADRARWETESAKERERWSQR